MLTSYQSMLDLLAEYKINTLKADGEILENNNLVAKVIKHIDQFKLKYRTLLEHVAFFILDNNISYKKEKEKIKDRQQ